MKVNTHWDNFNVMFKSKNGNENCAICVVGRIEIKEVAPDPYCTDSDWDYYGYTEMNDLIFDEITFYYEDGNYTTYKKETIGESGMDILLTYEDWLKLQKELNRLFNFS